jgi:hypothetical protein
MPLSAADLDREISYLLSNESLKDEPIVEPVTIVSTTSAGRC